MPLTASLEQGLRRYSIGEKLRSLRLKKSMGLVELGRHTGLSPALLSKVERTKLIPTLPTLLRIATVFSKDLSYFFETEASNLFRIHRGKERIRLPEDGSAEPTYFFESLGYLVPDRQLDPYWAEFVPTTTRPHSRPHAHTGYEFVYLTEGSLEIRYRNEVDTLEEGDSVYFDSSVPHSYHCTSKKAARGLVVITERMQPTMAQLRANPPGSRS